MAKTTSQSFLDCSISHLEEALQLRKQIEALQQKLSNLLGDESDAPTPQKRTGKRRGRVAKVKPEAAAKASPAAPSARATKGGRKKRSGMTPEARAKISAAMKARWEAKRKAA